MDQMGLALLGDEAAMITTSFTPIASAIGGALIGLSAIMLMAFTGRIAGVSGIAARLFPPYEDNEFTGRLAFVAGLIAAPPLVWLATRSLASQTILANPPVLVLAGLLAGFRLVRGHGLTSRHRVSRNFPHSSRPLG